MFSLCARFLTIFALVGLATVAASPVFAQSWNFGTVANISETLGVNDGRVCVGEGSRKDIGCPTYAPSVSAGGLFTATTIATGGLTVTGATSLTTVSATIGDFSTLRVNTVAGGAGLTLTNGSGGSSGPLDRISTSGVTSGANLAMVVADQGTVSFTLAGTAGAAYLHPSLGLVAAGVSTTGPVSATRLFVSTVAGGAGLTLTNGASSSTPGGVSGSIQFNSGGSFAGRNDVVVDSTGRVGIGNASPNAPLEVTGRVSATVLQLSTDGSACNASTVGTLRLNPVNDKLELCRRL